MSIPYLFRVSIIQYQISKSVYEICLKDKFKVPGLATNTSALFRTYFLSGPCKLLFVLWFYHKITAYPCLKYLFDYLYHQDNAEIWIRD